MLKVEVEFTRRSCYLPVVVFIILLSQHSIIANGINGGDPLEFDLG
jgi:hypothetical protein